MSQDKLASRVESMRRFNRFYTKQIGVLQENLLHSPYSLTAARVIYELAHHETTTATELGNELGLDAGHLSRILRDLKKQGVVKKEPSPTDGRQSLLSLTDKGQAAFATLNSRSQGEIGAMLKALSERDQARLMDAMTTIETLLGAPPDHKVPYILRPPQPGDMGWVVAHHGALYAQEYGWDEHFEALVAEIVAHFVQNLAPRKRACWLAENKASTVG